MMIKKHKRNKEIVFPCPKCKVEKTFRVYTYPDDGVMLLCNCMLNFEEYEEIIRIVKLKRKEGESKNG